MLVLVEMLAVEPADLLYVIGILSDEAHMADALDVADLVGLGLGEGDLPAVEGEEFIVGKLRVVGDENVVVGVGNNGISGVFIELLDLLGCQNAIRDIGMAMKICLVEITRFGQKILFHFDSSKIFDRRRNKSAVLIYSAFSAGSLFFFLGWMMIFICDQNIVAI